MTTRTIHIIGVDSRGLTAAQQQQVEQAVLVAGGKRLLERWASPDQPCCPITPLADSFPAMRQALEQGDVVVLASGDPLFYGIGRRLLAEFGPERVALQPALSAIQEACALFKMSWHGAALLSLHGREEENVVGLLLRRDTSLVLTDPRHSPDFLARELIAYLTEIEAHDLLAKGEVLVAENIGMAGQRIFRGGLAEAAAEQFAPLNVMALRWPDLPLCPGFGLGEEEISHSRGLITKDEVRAVTLHTLRLPKRGVLWDVGAGSGSIAIEAALLRPDLTIYAVEQRPEELAHIRANIRSFGCFNVRVVAGRAPQALAGLLDPDRVFVGGSGGSLAEIIALAARRLRQGGRLVVNGVLAATCEQAPRLLAENGLRVSQSLLSVSRVREKKTRVLNPITIMVGGK